MKGKFITFEGSEGSGKSTHSKLLCNYLGKRGHRVVHLREPGGTDVGERIREILLDPKNKRLKSECEMLLYMASRSQIVQEKILPALKKGKIVICDRFLDATVAYQGYGGGIDIRPIRQIGNFATHGLAPDLTIFLDMEVEEGLRRSGRNDRIEKRPLGYHRKVRRGYLALARKNPRRIKVFSAKGDLNQIQKEIRKAVLDVL